MFQANARIELNSSNYNAQMELGQFHSHLYEASSALAKIKRQFLLTSNAPILLEFLQTSNQPNSLAIHLKEKYVADDENPLGFLMFLSVRHRSQ